MTDAPPLKADPQDRPLPPSGGNLTAASSGAKSPASPSGEGKSPSQAQDTPPSAGAPVSAPAKPTAATFTPHTRPIGRHVPPPGDWRRTWPGFLAGSALIAVAIGLAWILWDRAGGSQVALPPPSPVAPVELAEIEALLGALGFPPGRIDGVIDAEAAAAIRDFQATAGLPADGAPSSALLEELRAAHAELFGGQ